MLLEIKKESKHKKQDFLQHLATVIRFSLPSLDWIDPTFRRASEITPEEEDDTVSQQSWLPADGRTRTQHLLSLSRAGEEQSTQTKTMFFIVNEWLSRPLPQTKKGNAFSRRINSDFSIRNNKYFPRYGRRCISFLGWHWHRARKDLIQSIAQSQHFPKQKQVMPLN